MQIYKKNSRVGRNGSALLLALIGTLILAGMAAAIMTVSGAYKQEGVAFTDEARALYIAEAGLSEGIATVQAAAPADFGSQEAPLPFGDAGYWGTVVDNGNQTFTVSAYAQVAGKECGVEAVMVQNTNDIYSSALFAGNSEGDPLYDMEFGGLGSQADQITGNIYSGGNVTIDGDATINGDIKATGTISGGSGTAGTLPVPDIAAMDYENNNDYDVKAMFSGASYKSNALGGSAWQMPESSPAHIFRKNPSDRTSNTSQTEKDDYFLEDPYESVNSGSSLNVSSSSKITLSGQDGNPGENGSDKVYFIDGNLWIHNKSIYSFAMYNSQSDPVKVTFIVKGNIYFSDNILYQDSDEDGVAFVSIKDERYEDSGNIYFGDPTFGTLEQMDAFMYAENNFYDSNLSASGSARVTVNGNMTAGNQVLIDRDAGDQHSKLTVNFDDRISTGALTLAGLPTSNADEAPWLIASWREVPLP